MPSILIVEDDPGSAEALCKYLQRSDYDVACVPDGRAALERVLQNTPDLVILDLFLPELDGGMFLEILRSYLRLQTLPVIILTGLSDSPMVDKARNLKVNAILLKGKATLDEIAEAVRTELHRAPN